MRSAALLALVLVLAGCREDAAEPRVLRIAERAQAPNPNAGLSSEPFLAGAARVEAIGYSDRPRFFVLARTPAIEKYPCTTCHTVPLDRMRGPAGSPRRAHWDVTLRHAPPAVMTCGTCHTPDAPGTLQTLQRTRVDLDHSYQVCAQCHARQGEDWASGAHGKRAGGWAPPRVVLACSQCHDPHQPHWDTRWPAVGGRTEWREAK
jgi:hypothetical protein